MRAADKIILAITFFLVSELSVRGMISRAFPNDLELPKGSNQGVYSNFLMSAVHPIADIRILSGAPASRRYARSQSSANSRGRDRSFSRHIPASSAASFRRSPETRSKSSTWV